MRASKVVLAVFLSVGMATAASCVRLEPERFAVLDLPIEDLVGECDAILRIAAGRVKAHRVERYRALQALAVCPKEYAEDYSIEDAHASARDPELKEMLRAFLARHGSVKKVTELYLTGELDTFEAMVFERDHLGAGEQMRLALLIGRKGSFQPERVATLCAAFPNTPWPSYGTPYTCSAQPPSP